MSNQEELVNELKASVDQDLKKRQKSIEDGEALDKVIHQQMDAGEIGISHGTDNHVSVIMLGLATVVTLFALYMIFGVSPDYYTG
ncbi:MAG: hypothetical protein VX943_02780 [SAR324 cluster bacterium]|jgi:hypothetical protein|nr:hypothetical protein [SAR324 cluster bacterium]